MRREFPDSCELAPLPDNVPRHRRRQRFVENKCPVVGVRLEDELVGAVRVLKTSTRAVNPEVLVNHFLDFRGDGLCANTTPFDFELNNPLAPRAAVICAPRVNNLRRVIFIDM